ncbi:hypothetical protein HZS_6741 [Henneguya salminicola]|nr:hypothetical protein HZS_6741 [Henneguya salminicola]
MKAGGTLCLLLQMLSCGSGNHPSITGNRRATATISAIVDGIGAFGAAISPFIGWDYVMYVLMASCFISGLNKLCVSCMLFNYHIYELHNVMHFFLTNRVENEVKDSGPFLPI